MHVLLYLKGFTFSLQVHANRDVQSFILIGEILIVCILHVATSILIPFLNINIFAYEVSIEVFGNKVLTLQIYHRTLITLLINKHNGADACLLSYKSIVSTKIRRDVHDTCTILSGHIITRNHLECITHRLDHG